MKIDMSTDNLAGLEEAAPCVGAFFDLDHTVLDGSSGMLFGLYMWRKGLLPIRQAASLAREGLLYTLGGTDFAAGSRKMMQLIAGIADDEMWQRSRAWFDELVAPRISAEARRRVRQHRDRGHQVALLSASTAYVTVPAAESLGLEAGGAIYTQLEIVDGIITGHVIEPICYGQGKVYWAASYARDHGIDLSRSFFYTDSFSDLPMLRAIGHPVAVNPDLRLRWTSRREGWPTVRFH